MRKYLLPKEGNFYKANLHCHSTVSDGKWSPEEIKEKYMEKGYSVIAYTDHDVMIDHSDLTDENFLALRGYEMEVNEKLPEDVPKLRRRTCHMCLIAIDPATEKQVCWHREKYLFSNSVNYRDQVKFDETLPDYNRVYTGEGVSEMMQMGRESGFFVTYNHPAWSLETRDEYLHYKGMHAMEICNYGCCDEGYEDYVPNIYDEILRSGNRIFCASNDDNHNGSRDKPADHDSFGGFNMIKAEKLEYTAITDALLKGDFYASMGPEIYDLYWEDGKIYLTCSPAARVTVSSCGRHARNFSNYDGTPITEICYEVRADAGYVRFTVTDAQGRHANTRGYFLDELN